VSTLKRFINLFAVIFVLNPALTHAKMPVVIPDKLYHGETGDFAELADITKQVQPGTVVIVSEFHGHTPHHKNQVAFLEQLKKDQGLTIINVGMEFIEYPFQSYVDQYLIGGLDEPDFLRSIQWGAVSYNFYRDQVLFPLSAQGTTIGLNSPRWLNSKVGKAGVQSLTPEEASFLPPQFSEGGPEYFDRFKEAMGGGHIPADKLKNYFAAQSIWDDTMAWKASEFIKANPNQILVIIVGDFHNAFESGLPERLRVRGVQNILTISQTDIFGLTEDEAKSEVQPHPKWGKRANFIWVSSEPGGYKQMNQEFFENLLEK
jgi:uncharacterized iron-regulated protein